MKKYPSIVLLALLAGSVSSSFAAIMELTVETPISGVSMPVMYPYLAAGDVAKLTVRYDTTVAATATYQNVYTDAITYFQFDLSRAGTLLYSGSSSGNFGRVRIGNSALADSMTFDVFTDSDRYNFHSIYPKGSEMASLSPAYDTNVVKGGIEYGDLGIDYIKLNFFGASSLFADSSLPDASVLGSDPFAPKFGNTPWSGMAIFEDLTARPVHSRPTDYRGSFGPGSVRDEASYPATFTVREYVETDSGNSQVPDSGMSVTLLALSLTALAMARRRES